MLNGQVINSAEELLSDGAAAVPCAAAIGLYLRSLNDIDAQLSRDLRPFQRHLTYTYTSWLHRAEGVFAEITEKAIRRTGIQSVSWLEKALRAYLARAATHSRLH